MKWFAFIVLFILASGVWGLSGGYADEEGSGKGCLTCIVSIILVFPVCLILWNIGGFWTFLSVVLYVFLFSFVPPIATMHFTEKADKERKLEEKRKEEERQREEKRAAERRAEEARKQEQNLKRQAKSLILSLNQKANTPPLSTLIRDGAENFYNEVASKINPSNNTTQYIEISKEFWIFVGGIEVEVWRYGQMSHNIWRSFDTLRIDELETDAQRMAFAIFYAQQVCDLLEKTHSGTFPHGSLTVTKELESTDWLFEYRYDGSPFFFDGEHQKRHFPTAYMSKITYKVTNPYYVESTSLF